VRIFDLASRTERIRLAAHDAEVLSVSYGPYGMSSNGGGGGRGLHSFTSELNLSNSRTNSLVELGYTVNGRAQIELKQERV
jgi:hypothetical protein